MNLLILSDTHGRAERLSEVVALTRPRTLLFLGDGLRDLSVLPPSVEVLAVRGNCDWMALSEIPDERLEFFGGKRLFLTHGHRYGVKGGIEAAAEAAARQSADVLLYGHTHLREERWLDAGERVGDILLEKPMLILCPGSLGEPCGSPPSFATLEIRPEGILAGFGEL